MKKLISLAVAAFLLSAGVASAATIPNIAFDNGDTTISGQGGTTVNATFRVNVNAGEVVEQVQTDVIGDNLSPVCTEVGGNLGLQEGQNDVNLAIKLPPNTGTYSVEIRTYGVFGGVHQPDCLSNQNGTASFTGAVRTVATGGTSTGGGSSIGGISDLMKLIAELQKQIAELKAPPAPTTSTKCAALTEHSGGAVMGTRNSANVTLQGYLLGEGASIPALAAGASFGFYGPQTAAAVSWFKSANHCA